MFHASRDSRPRRAPARRLLVDRLEDRIALSTTAFIDDGVLRIKGDRGDNALVLTIDPEADDAVTLTDGGAAVTIRGLDADALNFSAVKIEGGRGNDAITVNLSNLDPTSGPASRLALEIEGGPGNDTIVLNADDVTVPEGTTLDVDIEGGPGNDSVTMNLDGVAIAGRVDVDLEGGPGNDTFNLNAIDVALAATARVDVDLEGGRGNDAANLDLAGLTLEDGARVDVDAEGGPGTETVTGNDVTIPGVDLDFDDWDGTGGNGNGKPNGGNGKARGWDRVANTPAARNANRNAAFNRKAEPAPTPVPQPDGSDHDDGDDDGGRKRKGWDRVAETPAAENANPNAAFNRGDDDNDRGKSKRK